MERTSVTRRQVAQLLGASAVAGAIAMPGAARAENNLWRSLDFLGQDGRTFDFDELRAPLTLIKLWASTCPICIGEMSSLSTLASSMGPGNVEVILLSHPEYWSRDKEFARTRHLPFRLATLAPANSPSMVRAALTEDGLFAVPRTMIVNTRTGGMTWWRAGGRDWTSSTTLHNLKALA